MESLECQTGPTGEFYVETPTCVISTAQELKNLQRLEQRWKQKESVEEGSVIIFNAATKNKNANHPPE